ncbi:TetR/AcrR family transcriptional regulator [Calidifontibacillus oryziterrae]|uniref:TetR/AcrR family transcriptional regulator n=1 Tax=Calidifontibacillus oryziterrae TaxID=1191699 RepID=UPI0002E795F5|nr:TetR/AcrR family transcriptional regulator [Calidifontibacillus oryziterrae]
MSQLRDKIISTALTLFETHGYHGVTVNQIVEESGTSKGGFYHHFKSKDELLYMIHDYFISYVLEKANDANKIYESPTEKLRAIIQSFVKVFDLYKPHISVFYQESKYLKPEYDEIIKKKRDEYRHIIFKVVKEGIEAGEFRSNLPVEITGMSILGMVNWTYKWYKPEGKNTIEEIAGIYIDLLLHSLLTEEARGNEKYKSFFLQNNQ